MNKQNITSDMEAMSIEQVKEQLVELGKKRGVLSYKEITDRLAAFEQDSDQMDEFFEYLGDQGIEINNNENDDDDEVDEMIMKDEDNEEFDFDDLSVPPGIKINDPVRMYLKEIGRVPLLSAEDAACCSLT
mgnify:FL=1